MTMEAAALSAVAIDYFTQLATTETDRAAQA
jgi:hypothetical protein